MALSTDQDYEGYLERFAATAISGPALSRSEFHRYSDRLDELHLIDIECGLDGEQQHQLEALTALLLEAPLEDRAEDEDLEPPVPIIEIGNADERKRARDEQQKTEGRDAPVLFRQPRREVWRFRRYRR